MVRNPPANAGDMVQSLDQEEPTGEGNSYQFQYSCLENLGQRSLVGYSPWGHKKVGRDFHFHFFPREQVSFDFMAALTVHTDSGAQKRKAATVFTVSPSVCHE